MRQSVTITKTGTHVVDEIGARTAFLVAGAVVELPPSAVARLVSRGEADLVEVAQEDDAPVSRRSRRKAAEKVEDASVEDASVEPVAGDAADAE